MSGMTQPPSDESIVEEVWRSYLTTGKAPRHVRLPWYESPALRPIIRRLPAEPRCRVCHFPFEGVGGKLARLLLGVKPTRMNPQLCNVCDRFASKYKGGTELEVSLLFADVRGSTGLAEAMNPTEFGALINRFYRVTTGVLYRHGAMVEKLIGDEVTGFFVPGFSGPKHPLEAVRAGRGILKETGHEDPDGPWIPVGVGIHVGVTYVGAVTTDGGGTDISVLGDAANTGARLASTAGVGEIVISEAARVAAGLTAEGMTARRLSLKGRSEPVDAWVITVPGSDQAEATGP